VYSDAGSTASSVGILVSYNNNNNNNNNTSARQLLSDLGRKISESTGEAREASFLFQRCSVLMQRFNAILLHDSLPAYDCTD